MSQPDLPQTWDPAPLAAALNVLAGDTRAVGDIVFDFGPAGTVTVTLDLDLDLDATALPRNVLDGLPAQLAELSLLAAHTQTAPSRT